MDLTKLRLTKGTMPFAMVVGMFPLLPEQGKNPAAKVAISNLGHQGLAVLHLAISKSFVPSFFSTVKVFKDR